MTSPFRQQLMNWADSAKESKSTHTVMLMPAQYGSVEQCAKEARRISVGFSNMQRQLRQQVEKQCRNAGYDPPLVTPYEDVMSAQMREDARREREKAQPEPESAATAQQRADLEEHKRLMADPNAVDLSDW
jgi:hypothetical protein